jgi:hypothetical protein
MSDAQLMPTSTRRISLKKSLITSTMARSDKVEQTIPVPSEDPKKPKKEDESQQAAGSDPTTANGTTKGKDKEEPELVGGQ